MRLQRLLDVIAVLALLASMAIVVQRLSAGREDGSSRAGQPPARAGDRDGDGVPDSEDLAPDTPAPRPVRTPDAAQEAPRLPPADDCRRKGITRSAGGEGVCFEPTGRRVRVVDRDTVLRLPELDARIEDIAVRERRGEPVADITVGLTIRNKLDGTVDLRPDQLALVLGRQFVRPTRGATPSAGNTLFRRAAGLRARETASGTVTFTVRRRLAGRLGTSGNLQLLQFSDTDFATPSSTVGVLRTYR